MSSTASITSTPALTTITSVASHTALLSSARTSSRSIVLLFTSTWHAPCTQMVQLLTKLSEDPTIAQNVLLAVCDAEGVSDVTAEYEEIVSVPTTLVISAEGKVVQTIEGAQTEELMKVVKKCANEKVNTGAVNNTAAATSAAAASTPSPAAAAKPAAAPAMTVLSDSLRARLVALTNASPVMAFIKGTVETPRCGFTRQLITLLKEKKILFNTFDILSDQDVRDGLKLLSSWPTYPQLYVKGELVGGLDVIKELDASGELIGMIPEGHVQVDEKDLLTVRLKNLINSSRVMLFMKGSPAAPQCGFSNQIVALLDDYIKNDDSHELKYSSFDIFSDDQVREGLKEYSKWPTYPQLYVSGELIGGLDVVKELHAAGELKEILYGK